MKLLLDTHILLWWLNDSSELNSEIRAHIHDAENLVLYSAASIWEIRIKEALKKITLPKNFAGVLSEQSFDEIPVRAAHAHELAHLPLHHRDPFDRILVAQARIEGLTLVSKDAFLQRYKIPLLINH